MTDHPIIHIADPNRSNFKNGLVALCNCTEPRFYLQVETWLAGEHAAKKEWMCPKCLEHEDLPLLVLAAEDSRPFKVSVVPYGSKD